MAVQIENQRWETDKHRVDIERMRQEMKLEPWKMLFVGFGTGAGLVAAIVGLMTAILK